MRKLLLSLTILFIGIGVAFSQPPGPPPGPPPPVGIPIDGGLSIFLGLGAAYGARKVYKAIREKQHE